jgi:nitrate reductase cytochrome c-type subunit
MTMKRRFLLVLALVLFVGLVGTVAALTAAAAPALPGVNAADTFAKGCVDCHKKEGANDYTLATGLKAVKGHPDITKVVKNVPADCAMCHKPSTKAGPLGEALHKVHFEDAAQNVFVTVYGGQCLNCHKLDVATGTVAVKAGPANW